VAFAAGLVLLAFNTGACLREARPRSSPKATPATAASTHIPGFEADHPGVCQGSDRVTPPELLTKVMPTYPEETLKKVRVLSPIIVDAVINEEGRVVDPRIRQSDHPDLDPYVINAVRAWTYKPACLEGKPVAVFLSIVVRF
jgi:outer membrane biosynthesis protein TonB